MTPSTSVGPTSKPVDAFIDANDPDGSLVILDKAITEALPGFARVLWQGVFWGGTDQSIIGYGTITQPRPRGRSVDWFLVGLARQKNYLSLYVNAADGGTYLSQLYGPRLGTTKIGSASISFKSVQDIDLAVLAEMLRHASRVAEQGRRPVQPR
jgi:Domain of unknown function (DU1801)